MYTLAWWLALPGLWLRLLWRPGYRKRWPERFGFYNTQSTPVDLWLHAVSVGEVEAAAPLLEALLAHGQRLLVTTTTPTGAARVRARFASRVTHIYLPYDISFAVKRFLSAFQPRLALIMETELWPTLYQHCARHKIPVCVVNARLSQRSWRGYQKLSGLIQPLLQSVAAIGAQSSADAQRFIELGAIPERVQLTGNIKFNVNLNASETALGQQFKATLAGRFTLLLGSSHPGEEALILRCLRRWRQSGHHWLLIIAPRHPERFTEVAQLSAQHGFNSQRRSSGQPIAADTDVYILDTLGELKAFYAATDIAVVGGSFVPVGGHNLLEPAKIPVPILFGPHTDNIQALADGLTAVGGALQCPDEDKLVQAIHTLHRYPQQASDMAEQALRFAHSQQEALANILNLTPVKLHLQLTRHDR
ncbi:MAG: lipid IV(A) 3-deoxy-D-manno-octulosonic acid transferase [Methylococcales bacterium]|nr:lipid IV(A) 3-deoxy-D-manno-octulosonic acid transferase [Methylococcales bacterium]